MNGQDVACREPQINRELNRLINLVGDLENEAGNLETALSAIARPKLLEKLGHLGDKKSPRVAENFRVPLADQIKIVGDRIFRCQEELKDLIGRLEISVMHLKEMETVS